MQQCLVMCRGTQSGLFNNAEGPQACAQAQRSLVVNLLSSVWTSILHCQAGQDLGASWELCSGLALMHVRLTARVLIPR